jgi:hypothetical protein
MNPCKDRRETECARMLKLNSHLDRLEESLMSIMRNNNPADLCIITGLIEERERTRCQLHDLHIKVY